MAERPIIIRGGLSEPLPEEPTTRGGGSMHTGLSLYVESEGLAERLEFTPNQDETQWQLKGVKTLDIGIERGEIDSRRRRIIPRDGIFGIKLNRDPDRMFRPPPSVDNKFVLGIVIGGLAVWLLTRRS